MIERQIIAQKAKELDVQNFVLSYLGEVSCSHISMQRTPLGEKISVYTSRPGLIVGKKGANIKKLTDMLKSKFSMENPQLEVVEITNPFADAASVAKTLISGFDRFGPKRFKAMAYKALEDSLRAGVKGIEIVIAGRGVPGERAKTWRFSAGYLKKSGDISENFMDRSYQSCNLRSGTIGIKVSILHSDVVLPDDIKLKELKVEAVKVEQPIVIEQIIEKKIENVEVIKTEEKQEKPKKIRIKKIKVENKSKENVEVINNDKEN